MKEIRQPCSMVTGVRMYIPLPPNILYSIHRFYNNNYRRKEVPRVQLDGWPLKIIWFNNVFSCALKLTCTYKIR
jgi:hypothetical protein